MSRNYLDIKILALCSLSMLALIVSVFTANESGAVLGSTESGADISLNSLPICFIDDEQLPLQADFPILYQTESDEEEAENTIKLKTSQRKPVSYNDKSDRAFFYILSGSLSNLHTAARIIASQALLENTIIRC